MLTRLIVENILHYVQISSHYNMMKNYGGCTLKNNIMLYVNYTSTKKFVVKYYHLTSLGMVSWNKIYNYLKKPIKCLSPFQLYICIRSSICQSKWIFQEIAYEIFNVILSSYFFKNI